MRKKMAIGIGTLAALLLLAGVAAALLIDVDRYRPTLERLVADATGRKLAIDGPLSLQMFPRLGIALPKSTLSGPAGDGTFASLSSASVFVAWLPLLSGRVVVDQVDIDGLQATIERRADGRSNVDDLLQRRREAAPEKSGTAESSAIGVSIRGVSLRNASLSLRAADGSTVALSNLDLELDDIASSDYKPVRLSASVRSSKPALLADLTLTAELQVDAPHGRYGVRDLKGSAKGSFEQQPMEIGLAAARAVWQPQGVEGEKLVVTLTVQGAQRLDLRITGDDIKGNAPALEATIAATLQRDSGSRRLAVTLASPLRANLDALTFELPRLLAEIGTPPPNAARNAVKLSFGGSASLDLKRELAAMRIKSVLDGSNLSGSLDLTGFERPRIAFDVAADRLDLDRHFPPVARNAKPAAPAASGGKSPPADAIDLSGLRGLHATGSVRVGQVRLRGVDATDVRLALQAKDGSLDVAPLTARLYEGTVSAKLTARAQGSRIGGTGQITGLALKPLMVALGNTAKLEGRTDLKFDLSTSGETTDALRRQLGGSLSIAVRDGAIRGIDVVETLTGALGFIAARKTHAEAIDEAKLTRFSSLTASAQIERGVATSKDLQAVSDVLRISGSGRLDLVAEELDYLLRAQMTASPLGADRRLVSSLLGYTVPIHLAGPLDALKYRVDWVAVGADMVTRRALGGVSAPVIEEAVKGLGSLLGGKKDRAPKKQP